MIIHAKLPDNEKGAFFEGLYYETCGLGDPIIALHGFGETLFTWRHAVSPLSRHHTLYLFDLMGHGKSEKPTHGDYSLNNQTEKLFRFITKHDLRKVTLLGHSMGGGVALLLAIRLMNEGQGRLFSLMLIDAIAFPQKLPIWLWFLRLPVLPRYILPLVPSKISVKMILRTAYFDRSKISKDVILKYASNLESNEGINAIIRTAKQIIPDNLEEIIAHYADIKVPTMIMWGRQDKLVSPAIGVLLNAHIEKSILNMIDHCGHIPHEEVPSAAIPHIVSFVNNGPSL